MKRRYGAIGGDWIVTVTATSFVDVVAIDADHARRIVERQLAADYGTTAGRVIEIVDVEAA